ncbi:hypothetical protein ACFVUW_28565 [Streptomyces xiamenensis]|uniref:hypothetical protein n=1 Tax=Streptomyces xiamenensis TaxID=408015 RepID=UPI0036E03C11
MPSQAIRPDPAQGGAQPRRQRVKVPLRLITTTQYADVAVSVYVKIAALAARPQGCTALTATIAGYLGLSKSSVERGMTQLRRPGPDGVVELASVRRSLPGGSGTSALRRVRPLTATERFVWLPVAAAEDLTPRQLRVYALVAYSQVQAIPLTESEIARALHHHSGRRAGKPLTTAAAGEIVDSLEMTRWITVERRAGSRGRHRLIAHDIPRPAKSACGQPGSRSSVLPATRASGEGSGPSADAGSLANKEIPRTDQPDDVRALSSPAVGEVQVSAGPQDHGAQPQRVGAKGRLALRADDPTHSRSKRNPSYSGPQLTISARIHSVLEPVRWLYRQTTVYVQRLIAREVGQQLRWGVHDSRLRHRLTRRLAGTMTHEIRDPGRWILGVGLPHWGCGIHDCEAGVLWNSGRPCAVCEELVLDRRRPAASENSPLLRLPPATASYPRTARSASLSTCRSRDCALQVSSGAGQDGLCPLCCEGLESERLSTTMVPPPENCVGWDGTGCTRPALGTASLCVRCRTRQIECAAA